MEGFGGIILGIIFLAVAVPFYFFPALIAWLRQPEQIAFIVMLNALLGWTVVGWIAVLIFVMYGPREAGSASTKIFKSNWPQS